MSRADVSLRAKEAVIVFEPTQVTVEQMVDAVNRLGFHASVKGTRSSASPLTGGRKVFQLDPDRPPRNQ